MFVSGCVCVLSVFGESFVGLRRLTVGPQLRRCGSLTPHTPRLPPVSVCVSGCGTGAAHFPGVGHWRPQSVSGGRLGSGPLISSWLGDLLGCGGGRPGLCLLACWPGRVCRLPPACPARCAAPRAQRLLAAWAGASAWAAVILASTGKPAALPSPPPPPAPQKAREVWVWSHKSLQDPWEGMEPLFPGLFRLHFLLQLLALAPRLATSLLASGRRGWWVGQAWVHTHSHTGSHSLLAQGHVDTHTQLHRHTHSLTQGHMGTHFTHSHIHSYTHTQSHAVAHISQCRFPADICCPQPGLGAGIPYPPRASSSPLQTH